ncbi:MAG: GMP synthase [Thermoprotei archaeon]
MPQVEPYDDSELLKASALPASRLAEELIALVKQKALGENVLAAVSGGIDSTVAALITIRALGDRVHPVFIDTGFMREGEAHEVKSSFDLVSTRNLEVINAKEKFYHAVKSFGDAEEKRVAFREAFYSTLRQLAQERHTGLLVQGTIAPDWIETTGGIKTQHNVLRQIGIRTEEKYGFRLLEPLAYLYKDQVRALGEQLGLPQSFILRQPFPGPGLLIRAPGQVTLGKIEVLRPVTRVVEKRMSGLGGSQWFAAIFDAARKLDKQLVSGSENWVFTQKVTGVKGDARVYGELIGVGPAANMSPRDFDSKAYALYSDANTILRELLNVSTDFFRVCLRLAAKHDSPHGYSIVVRAVKTSDFMTADVLRPPFPLLKYLAEEILETHPDIRDVYYDVTPKPPATIEYE